MGACTGRGQTGTREAGTRQRCQLRERRWGGERGMVRCLGHKEGRGATGQLGQRGEEEGRLAADQAHIRMKILDFVFGCVAIASPIHRARGNHAEAARTAGTEVRAISSYLTAETVCLFL